MAQNEDFKLSVNAIKAKIAALMAKAQNEDGTLPEGVTEAEAATFSAAAVRLATKFNLDLAEASGWQKGHYDRFETKLGRTRWKRELLASLCSYTYCKLFYTASTATSIIIGEQHNRELVMLMYNTLTAYLEPAAQQAHRIHGNGVHARHWKDHFFDGAVQAVANRLHRQKEEDTQTHETDTTIIETNTAPVTKEVAQTRALMVVKDQALNEAIEKFIGKKIRTERRKIIRWDTNAWSHGYEAGKAAPMTNRKQIEAGAK